MQQWLVLSGQALPPPPSSDTPQKSQRQKHSKKQTNRQDGQGKAGRREGTCCCPRLRVSRCVGRTHAGMDGWDGQMIGDRRTGIGSFCLQSLWLWIINCRQVPLWHKHDMALCRWLFAGLHFDVLLLQQA